MRTPYVLNLARNKTMTEDPLEGQSLQQKLVAKK